MAVGPGNLLLLVLLWLF